MKLGTLCLAQNCSRHRAPCHTSHPWWAAHLHLAHALLPSQWYDLPPLLHFPMILFSARYNPAPIYVNWVLVHWPNAASTGYEPKHLAENKQLTEDKRFAEDKDLAEHKDLYVSNPCPSTNRSQRRPTILVWEHCDAPSWVGLGRLANSCSAGFTTVLA